MENDYAIEMLKITKTFNNGTIVANKEIDLRVKKGEIHALVGENGAGKSTLMSILFGLYQPTSGEILVNGRPEVISSPIKATQLGIGMVHQHFKLVQINTVWQNIALGSEDVIGGLFLNATKIKHDITQIMKKYELYVDLDAKIEDVSVGMQQRVEILKILYRKAEILVLDEPTAVLTPAQITGLLKIMQKLKEDGKTIIFISHKMEEIKKIADSATVIRLGKNVQEFDMQDVKGNELAEAMVGRKLANIKNKYLPFDQNKVVLDVLNLTVKKATNPKLNGLENFNIQVHAGEILAIAGVEGNGQRELVDAITGLTKPSTGGIVYKDLNIIDYNINQRYKLGMSHIPEDRHKYGMLLDFPLFSNIVLQNIDEKPFSNYGIIDQNQINLYTLEVINSFDVRGARGGKSIARGLSGGNQQKAIVGRELTRPHDLLIVVQPTRGLDIGAIEYIHNQILKEKEKGTAILLVSYELNEVLALSDTIAVLSEGHLTGVLPGKGAKKEVIGALMAGKKIGREGQSSAHKTKAVNL